MKSPCYFVCTSSLWLQHATNAPRDWSTVVPLHWNHLPPLQPSVQDAVPQAHPFQNDSRLPIVWTRCVSTKREWTRRHWTILRRHALGKPVVMVPMIVFSRRWIIIHQQLLAAIDAILDPVAVCSYRNLGILPIDVVRHAIQTLGLSPTVLRHHFSEITNEDGTPSQPPTQRPPFHCCVAIPLCSAPHRARNGRCK